MRHVQGCFSWFGSYSRLFCAPVCALGWILQSHRWSYTTVCVSSTGFPRQCHRQGTLSIPYCTDTNSHVEQHHLSWTSTSTLCPPPRRSWEPLMLLSSGHPLANCNIQPEAPDLRYQVQEERTEGEEGVEEM